LLAMSLRKIRNVRKLPGYARDQNIRLWTSALWAAMAAYTAGAAFASTEYNLFPYFMVGYICALYKIASNPNEQTGAPNGNQIVGGQKNLGYDASRERELAWSR
jgi:hypothetical protein